MKDDPEEKPAPPAPAPGPGRVTEALFSPFAGKSPREALADRLVMKILADDAAAKKALVELARSGNPEDVELARAISARVLEAEG